MFLLPILLQFHACLFCSRSFILFISIYVGMSQYLVWLQVHIGNKWLFECWHSKEAAHSSVIKVDYSFGKMTIHNNINVLYTITVTGTATYHVYKDSQQNIHGHD